ncbi:adenine deaminase [Anaeramoeba ignava]|uniref:adenine deaminase n=1 Tax=Anaeramoeba ignava TaxID=1746090 RepID=A0A9Q0REC7_ANAIG|nr:adenine deaminase [Anaeramoeba ignava]
MQKISGNIVDVISGTIFPGIIEISDGKIKSITKNNEKYENYILPGLIDAHIHIESSMLPPSEFARLAVCHGVIGTVSDPHEIANVLGVDGVKFMIDNSKLVPFYFCFGIPSCVPATPFETSGANFGVKEIEEIIKKFGLTYFSEMMNFPGVINRDSSVMEKIDLVKKYGLIIDGHAPAVRGEDLKKYFSAGITTDHECMTIEEAEEKINIGMKVLIREGSAAKNLNALHSLFKTHPEMIMLCSDDRHPNDLVDGHIDQLIQRIVADYKHDFISVVRASTLNPKNHYKLDNGLLSVGDSADIVVMDQNYKVLQTIIKGKTVFDGKNSLIPHLENIEKPNNFELKECNEEDFYIKPPENCTKLRVIKVMDGELFTEETEIEKKMFEIDSKGNLLANQEIDCLKIAVISRYSSEKPKPALGLIQNFGLKNCAIASSVSHDSHNVIVIGTSEQLMMNAVNQIVKFKGGISISFISTQNQVVNEVLPLEIAGLLSADDGYLVAQKYSKIDKIAQEAHSKLKAPFMTLSFMALTVIPKLKISDFGLFDGIKFQFTNLFI